MRKFKKILMLAFVAMFAFIGLSSANAVTFDTMSTKYSQCVSENLSSYGASNKNEICKLYSVTTGDTPVNTVFCLEAAKDIVWGTYTSVNITYNGMACAVLDIVNDSTFSSAIGIDAYDWNGSTGNNIYINSYNNINLTNFVTIQKYIWNHAVNGTGACTQKNTVTRSLTTGTLKVSNDDITLTKSGDNYVGSFTVTSSNLNNGYTYTSSSDDVVVTKSGDTFSISVPASKVDSIENYVITLNGNYNSSQTLRITPFLVTYKCIEGVGNCDTSTTYQTLGEIGFTRDILTSTSPISVRVNLTIYPSGTLKVIKTNEQTGVPISGVKFQLLDINGNAAKDINGNLIGVKTTNASGELTISNLPYGTYTIREVETPVGYIGLVSETVTINANNVEKKFTNKQTEVIFKKIWNDNGQTKQLEGATLKLVDSNGKDVKDKSGNVITWTTNGSVYKVANLEPGTYRLVETKAPAGFKLAEDVTFTLKADGTITSSNLDSSNSITVVMTNKQTEVTFSKQDITTKKELPGAILQILDKDKKEITDSNGKILYRWVSTGTVYKIEGLPVGNYYLKEVDAPDGYVLNKDLIEFEIKSDGTITSKNLNKDKTKIELFNEKIKTSFSKQDATTGKELPGATLQILDKDKKEIKDKDGKILYQWVSTDKPYVIEGLPVGVYYLKEVIQPEGYELNEELVKFEVKADGTVTKVVMKNTPNIPVPDTALSKSGLLLMIGAVLGLAGIGLIIYTIIKRKNSKI